MLKMLLFCPCGSSVEFPYMMLILMPSPALVLFCPVGHSEARVIAANPNIYSGFERGMGNAARE